MKSVISCETCSYSEVIEGSRVCVRNPPQGLPTQQKHPITGQVGVAILAYYPPVIEGVTCGEYYPEDGEIEGAEKATEKH